MQKEEFYMLKGSKHELLTPKHKKWHQFARDFVKQTERCLSFVFCRDDYKLKGFESMDQQYIGLGDKPDVYRYRQSL